MGRKTGPKRGRTDNISQKAEPTWNDQDPGRFAGYGMASDLIKWLTHGAQQYGVIDPPRPIEAAVTRQKLESKVSGESPIYFDDMCGAMDIFGKGWNTDPKNDHLLQKMQKMGVEKYIGEWRGAESTATALCTVREMHPTDLVAGVTTTLAVVIGAAVAKWFLRPGKSQKSHTSSSNADEIRKTEGASAGYDIV